MLVEMWRNGRRGQAIHDGESWMLMSKVEKTGKMLDVTSLLLRCRSGRQGTR